MGQEHFDSLIWRVHDYHPEIIKRVVYSIPDLIIQNPESTYADLAMGGGQFLQGVLNRCIESGQSREQILPRLYGFERSKVYLNYGRWRNNLQGVNLAILDPERDLNSVSMKFDVVIGNPPYSLPKGQKAVSDGTKNLSLKFIEKANSLLKPEGYISMLTPLNFLKPTDREKPTRSFSVFEGLKLSFIETGVQRSWFPGIGTSIALWGAVKTVKNCKMTLNGVDWDLSQTPFIVDLDRDQLLVFKKVWWKLNSKEEVVVCRRVKDGNELPPEGWSLTERVNRRLGKKFVVPWADLPVREKYEQIHISLDPEKAQRLFSQSHVRFFVKATNIEPTLYHNLFNGLSFNSQNFSTQEMQVIENYLGCG